MGTMNNFIFAFLILGIVVCVIYYIKKTIADGKIEEENINKKLKEKSEKYPIGTQFEAIGVLPYSVMRILPGAIGTVNGYNISSVILSFEIGNHCAQDIYVDDVILLKSFKLRGD
jgi:hypothetical protein